jgi:hypothetical protein
VAFNITVNNGWLYSISLGQLFGYTPATLTAYIVAPLDDDKDYNFDDKDDTDGSRMLLAFPHARRGSIIIA